MSAAILIVVILTGAGPGGVVAAPPMYFPDGARCEAARPHAAGLVRAEIEAGGTPVRAALAWCLEIGAET